MKRRIQAGVGLGLGLCGLLGCSGELGAPAGTTVPPTIPPPTGGGGGGGGGGPGGGNGQGGGAEARPAPSPRFIRLTHSQWARTVEEVLGYDRADQVAQSFRADSFGAAFIFDNPAGLQVDESLWSGYQRAAAEVARDLVSDAQAFGRLVGGVDRNSEGVALWLDQVAPRLFGQPLSAQDRGLFVSVHEAGRTLNPDLDPFEAGFELMLEAMLQSPLFLYRIEEGTPGDDGLRQLNGWELASRLSYFLWNSPPDAELIQLAQDGRLTQPDVLRSQAERMLASPRARDVVIDFHEQLLNVSKFSTIEPSPAFFPNVSERLPELAATENRLFLQMVFNEGSLETLLTSNRSFVNQELAEIYGLEGAFDDDFMAVELPPDQRRGVFTQVGWLATYATSAAPDPIHRGVFLSERMACNHITLPPADIPPLPEAQGRTNRELVEQHTESDPDCAGCHGSLINPFGFAFESYDAIGAYRTEDAGLPVDTSGTPLVGGRIIQVDGALDLMQQLATHPAVHECYAQHWLEFAFGRVAGAADQTLVEDLGDRSLAGDSVQSLILALVESRPFRTRVEENQ